MNFNKIFEHVLNTDMHVSTEDREKWDNCLKLVDGYVDGNLNIDSSSNIRGIMFHGSSSNYASIFGDEEFLNLSVQGGSDLSIHKKITLTSQGIDGGVVLYNATKLLGGVENNYKELLQYDSSTNRIILGDYFIPTQIRKALELPKIDIYNNNNILEGSIEWDSYTVDNVAHDGIHLRHEDGKYLVLGHLDNTAGENGTVYSYMICDVDGVLKNESDGDDWGPVRFEQNVFFRHGLRISSGEPLIINNYNVATKIANLENAISTGTGMVKWTNVLNKPSTLSGYGITDALPLSGGTITGILKILKGKNLSAFDGTNDYNLIELNPDNEIKVGDYNKTVAFRSAQHFIFASSISNTHFTCIGASTTSGESLFGSRMQNGTDFSSYLRVGSSSLQYNNGTSAFNIFHEGNTQKILPAFNSNSTAIGVDTTKLLYIAPIASGSYGLFPTISNANAILELGLHPRGIGSYTGQLGFSGNGRMYYRYYNSEDPINNQNKPWNTIAFTTDSSNGLQLKTTSGSYSSDKNKWTKIASVSISHRYGQSDICFLIQSFGEVTDSILFGLVIAKIKQQNAMGGTPNVAISMPISKNFSVSDVVGVITENSTSNSKLDIYVKYLYDWMNYNITKINGNGAFETYTNQSNVDILPSGTQVKLS